VLIVVCSLGAACASSDSTADSVAAVSTTLAADVASSTTEPPSTEPTPTEPVSTEPTDAAQAGPATGGAPRADTCPVEGNGLTCWKVYVPIDPTDPASDPIDLAVTVRRASPDSWTSPVLILTGVAPKHDWAPGAYQVELAGHDQIWIDLRAYGRSDGAVACPDFAKYSGQFAIGTLTTEAASAYGACLDAGEASVVPVSTSMDNGIVAADFVAVRQALGIDAWGLYSSNSGANIALNMLAIDEAATSAWFATSPEIVGHGLSPNNMAEALQRYAADCAKAPTCAAFGDFAALFDAVLAKVDVNGATGVVEPGTGVPIVFDRASVQNGVRFAMGDRTLAPLLPMLLSGIVDGTQVDTVANYYVNQIPPMTPLDAATQCQDRDFVLPGITDRDESAGGPFTGVHFTCTGLGPVPQFTEAPEVTSSIPVMVVTTSYDSRSSETNVTAITTGLSDVIRVFVPGLANSPLELGDCYLGVVADFFAGGPTDTSCMTSPAVATLNPA
jgi:pimeloyl-ACP methyl ester carboxylesterase